MAEALALRLVPRVARPRASSSGAGGPRSTPVHWRPTRPAIVVAWLAPIATLSLWLFFVVDTVERRPWSSLPLGSALWIVPALLAATVLSHCSAMYLLGRAGALVRMRAHHRTSRRALNTAFRHDRSSMTVLVPSYAEEPRTVAATLWSAALQEFPDLRVVPSSMTVRTPGTPPSASSSR